MTGATSTAINTGATSSAGPAPVLLALLEINTVHKNALFQRHLRCFVANLEMS